MLFSSFNGQKGACYRDLTLVAVTRQQMSCNDVWWDTECEKSKDGRAFRRQGLEVELGSPPMSSLRIHPVFGILLATPRWKWSVLTGLLRKLDFDVELLMGGH
eukprot:TRINITY_DN11634_c0_g1_i1.p1 TRINITY_DN11634_c0_g1~~TRINITY_DN11634_c0_g1_i1.p1  ORF type:complete len:103 (+),score=0.41 TRINITY_DN11634_c0_g1_i1:81-389(+)